MVVNLYERLFQTKQKDNDSTTAPAQHLAGNKSANIAQNNKQNWRSEAAFEVILPLTSHLTMFEGLLLLKGTVIHMALSKGIRIERHAASDAATADGKAGLGIEDGVAALSSLDELGVLLLEDLEVALSLPVPDAVSCEEQIHLLKSALVGFGIQGPDHGNCDYVGGGKNIISLFVKSLEHDGAEKGEPAIAHGPPHDSPGVTLGTDLEREDLSGVQPWDREPGGTEGCCEEEDHSDCTRRKGLGFRGPERMVLGCARESTSKEESDTLHD